MSTDVLVLGAMALLAVVALIAAVVALRSARRAAQERAELRALVERLGESAPVDEPAPAGQSLVPVSAELVEPSVARVVEGQVFVVPSQRDVVATALSRPATRVSVVVHGLAHALRPETRDRIAALMRREYTRRRRERLKVARHAARNHVPAARSDPAGTAWIGTAEVER